jgi:ankyrin repeat protein
LEKDRNFIALDQSERLTKHNRHNQKVLDIDAKTKSGHTALHTAVFSGQKLCAKCLLASGADVTVKSSGSKSALYYAARAGDEDLILLLLEYGGGYDIRDSSSRNPYLAALGQGHGEIAKKLLDDALQKGKEYVSNDCIGRMLTLATVGNGTNTAGTEPKCGQKVFLSTGLGLPIQTDDLELCSALIEFGVDIDLPISSSSGGCSCGVCTPLIIALRRHIYTVAGRLIEKGAKLQGQTCNTGDTRGYTPFHFAVLNDCPKYLYLLLLERVPAQASMSRRSILSTWQLRLTIIVPWIGVFCTSSNIILRS